MKPEKKLAVALKDAGVTLALAESCTGGAVADRLVALPGISEVFRGGVVAYTDEVKREVLGVSPETLEEHTAVSEAVAREMAEGALRLFSSDLAVSVTGIAGPGGATPCTPVGRVLIGLATAEGSRAFGFHFRGGRQAVRRKAVRWALDLALSEIQMMRINKT